MYLLDLVLVVGMVRILRVQEVELWVARLVVSDALLKLMTLKVKVKLAVKQTLPVTYTCTHPHNTQTHTQHTRSTHTHTQHTQHVYTAHNAKRPTNLSIAMFRNELHVCYTLPFCFSDVHCGRIFVCASVLAVHSNASTARHLIVMETCSGSLSRTGNACIKMFICS